VWSKDFKVIRLNRLSERPHINGDDVTVDIKPSQMLEADREGTIVDGFRAVVGVWSRAVEPDHNSHFHDSMSDTILQGSVVQTAECEDCQAEL